MWQSCVELCKYQSQILPPGSFLWPILGPENCFFFKKQISRRDIKYTGKVFL